MTIILNDIHIGFSRQGGTTPASREALRKYLLNGLREALTEHSVNRETLVIAGDLFDAFEVDGRDWLDTFLLLNEWLTNDNGLVLVAGNHDWSPKGEKVSSFQMLAAALVDGKAVTVVNIDHWSSLGPGLWAIAHCSNQDIFDWKMGELLDQVKEGDHVLIHANFDNNFAAKSDHSLNVSRDMAYKFVEKGVTLLFAHEHQAREAFKGKVICMGNQWPTSIADCLNNDRKFLHTLHDGVLLKHETWVADQNFNTGNSGFEEINWRELDKPTKAGFIRVVGEATANEASDVIDCIVAFRKVSNAFVIANMVKIAGIAEAAALPEQFEAVARYDVMDYIQQNVTPEEMVVVNKLLEQA